MDNKKLEGSVPEDARLLHWVSEDALLVVLADNSLQVSSMLGHCCPGCLFSSKMLTL